MRKGFTIVVFLLLGYFFHLAVGWAKGQSFAWYSQLAVPDWTPTKVGFQRIWAAVFILISITGALFWLAPRGKERNRALGLWVGMFLFSAAWHFSFYYFQSLLACAVSITALVFVVALAIRAARKVDEAAIVFLVPYELWIIYAAVLFWTIYFMN